MTVCRFPWVELGFELEWYPKFLRAATGIEVNWDMLNVIGDRIFNLTRAFWVRHYNKEWTSQMDVPPARWFDEPTKKGTLKGSRLDRTQYDDMLQMYYRKRGWDEKGIPTKTMLRKLGLDDAEKQLGKKVKLAE